MTVSKKIQTIDNRIEQNEDHMNFRPVKIFYWKKTC